MTEGIVGRREEKLRITFVLWGATLGGAETLTAAIAGRMRQRGVDARILFAAGAGDGPLCGFLDRAEIPYAFFGARGDRDLVIGARRIARLLEDLGPDAVVLTRPSYMAAAIKLGGYRTGPVVAVEHGGLLQVAQMPFARRVRRIVDRALGCKALDAEIAVSDFMKQEVMRRPHARRVLRIYNGVDLERFSPPTSAATSQGPIVGCAARLVPGKGIETVVQAFPHLLQRHPDARLRIAGDGPYGVALRDLTHSVGVEKSVEFLGWARNMEEFWARVDIAVVPSDQWIESFGMSALEAMACAKPVIASMNGALPEVVRDGETGRLYPAGDTQALAVALCEYADDKDRRHADGRRGRALSEATFDVEDAAQNYLKLLLELRD